MTDADVAVRRIAALRPWRLRTTARRTGRQWRLLGVVAVVAVLVTTLIAALTLLVTITEQRGTRAVLTSADPDSTAVTVRFEDLRAPTAQVRASTETAMAALLGRATVTAAARSEDLAVIKDGVQLSVTWFAAIDGVREQVVLRAGAWPSTVTEDLGGSIPVAIPQGVESLGLALGETAVITGWERRNDVTVTVVGVYVPKDVTDRIWDPDTIHGGGYDPATSPGPLMVDEEVLDANGIAVTDYVLRAEPDVGDIRVADLPALLERLTAGEDLVLPLLGDVAARTRYATRLDQLVSEVATALVVTRASVLVVSLLLVLLAVAALLQAARLLAEARHDEHNLMRARGASGRQLLTLATFEATTIAVAAAAAGPPAARWVYLLLADRPAMADAGMAGDPGTPPQAWVAAAAVAALLGVVVVSPLLRRAGTFLEGEQARSRPDRRAMLTRSGLDVALVVLAGIAYWQLQSYRSPVGGRAGTLFVDPVLVAGPALVLLAGALIAVRLLPAASRLTEALAARGRGVVSPLAAWEVGRRSTRATSAVLLLTLALAVGTFSQAFLSTWRHSQADQAAYTVGAPVRFADSGTASTLQAAALAAPGAGQAEPVLRTDTQVIDMSSRGFQRDRRTDGRAAELLALSGPAGDLLDRGRLSRLGGAAIAATEVTDPLSPGSIELPGDVAGFTATVRARSTDGAAPDSTVLLRLVLEDAVTGLLSTVDLGTVPMDGAEHTLRTPLPDSPTPVERQGPLRLAGLQTTLTTVPYADVDPEIFNLSLADFELSVQLKDLATLTPDDDAGVPLDVIAPAPWSGTADGILTYGIEAADGWQLGLDGLVLAAGLRQGPVSATQFGWETVRQVPVVMTAALAERVGLDLGSVTLPFGGSYALVVGDTVVPLRIVDTVRRVPTTTDTDVVVTDRTALARALIQSGASTPAVSEWWVDVADAGVADYLAGLGTDPDGVPIAERATAQVLVAQDMAQHPLRVATQAALWLVTLAAALLAAVGFGVHATVSLRARAVEFAQLRAIGLSRGRLTAVVGAESLLLCLLGAVFGIGIGALLGWLVGPLVAVSASGRSPVPSVVVHIPWGQISLLAVEVVAVLAAVVVLVARNQRTIHPAAVLRAGDER
jgi:hypothetical protein